MSPTDQRPGLTARRHSAIAAPSSRPEEQSMSETPQDEVRTRRLAVLDDHGNEPILGEIVKGNSEMRVDLPGCEPLRSTSLLLFTHIADRDMGPGLGLRVLVDGDEVLVFGAWHVAGDWMTEVVLGDE